MVEFNKIVYKNMNIVSVDDYPKSMRFTNINAKVINYIVKDQ